jgi:(R,R)-butanediol dehydrogenase/meso-butanediol dehydrogenase/diacetyl reductase
VPSIIVRCGRCPACLNGYEAQCENLSEIGIHFDGSFADYVAVPEITVHKVARDLDPDIGASIEPVAVSYSAVKKVSGIIAGSKVIVYGPGPIGLYMTQILALAGASKIVVIGASSENRLALARSYGALTIKTSTENMDEKLKEYLPPNGKADYIFEASGAADALGQLTKYIAPHGEIILAGVYKEAGAVDLIDIVRTECRIKGTFCYTLSEFEKAIDLVSEGKINFEGIVSKFSLDELTEGFESTIHKKSIKVILEVNAP